MEKVDKLEMLYQTVENCKKLHLDLPDGVLEQINSLEEQLIKDEVLPQLHENIEPVLRKVKRPLVLVVDYEPNGALRVNLSRRVNISKILPDAKEITTTPKEKPDIVSDIDNKPKKVKIKRSPQKGLNVYFGDDIHIYDRKASTTFCLALDKMGLDKAEKLNITNDGDPLISKKEQKGPNAVPHKVGNTGYYVNTHSGTRQKKLWLEKIAKALGINIEVVVSDKD